METSLIDLSDFFYLVQMHYVGTVNVVPNTVSCVLIPFSLTVHPVEILDQLVQELYCFLKMGLWTQTSYKERMYEHHYPGRLPACYQPVSGVWKINNAHLRNLCDEALELKNSLRSFHIQYIPREYNTEADAQANRAINLRDGQVEEDRL
ncbi:uncharacterized protein LOC123891744 [Trifolium pratense]|uniref:uncharacterized protein LOC123891744 n=1 Tax=Trifolium pratense TaxID=57577 RepID=UPI001E696FBA|nr:uncharacterized protein LOC123891744 [Trifolium pratense]